MLAAMKTEFHTLILQNCQVLKFYNTVIKKIPIIKKHFNGKVKNYPNKLQMQKTGFSPSLDTPESSLMQPFGF